MRFRGRDVYELSHPAQSHSIEDARIPLSLERICKAALAIIDADGLEALSMRRLASDLGVSAMALYNHVPNKDALLECVTQQLLQQIDLGGPPTGDWMGTLKAAVLSFRRVLLAHPNTVVLLQEKRTVTPESLTPIEWSLSILRSAGLDTRAAINAHRCIVGYTMGHVAMQCTDPFNNPDRAVGEVELRQQQLSPEQFPHLLEALPLLLDFDQDESFESGIDFILRGIRAQIERREDDA
jgi:AcrR family transcriptional regulator